MLQVKKAFYKQARKFHPDKNPGNEEKANAMMQRVNEAYEKCLEKMEPPDDGTDDDWEEEENTAEEQYARAQQEARQHRQDWEEQERNFRNWRNKRKLEKERFQREKENAQRRQSKKLRQEEREAEIRTMPKKEVFSWLTRRGFDVSEDWTVKQLADRMMEVVQEDARVERHMEQVQQKDFVEQIRAKMGKEKLFNELKLLGIIFNKRERRSVTREELVETLLQAVKSQADLGLKLRFAVGLRVECYAQEWLAGKIIKLWYREPDWKYGRWAAYQVELDCGRLLHAPLDDDCVIRQPRPSAPSKTAPPSTPSKASCMDTETHDWACAVRINADSLLYTMVCEQSIDQMRGAIDKEGNTVLHYCCYYQRRDMIEQLIGNAHDDWWRLILASNSKGETPAMLVSGPGCTAAKGTSSGRDSLVTRMKQLEQHAIEKSESQKVAGEKTLDLAAVFGAVVVYGAVFILRKLCGVFPHSIGWGPFVLGWGAFWTYVIIPQHLCPAETSCAVILTLRLLLMPGVGSVLGVVWEWTCWLLWSWTVWCLWPFLLCIYCVCQVDALRGDPQYAVIIHQYKWQTFGRDWITDNWWSLLSKEFGRALKLHLTVPLSLAVITFALALALLTCSTEVMNNALGYFTRPCIRAMVFLRVAASPHGLDNTFIGRVLCPRVVTFITLELISHLGYHVLAPIATYAGVDVSVNQHAACGHDIQIGAEEAMSAWMAPISIPLAGFNALLSMLSAAAPMQNGTVPHIEESTGDTWDTAEFPQAEVTVPAVELPPRPGCSDVPKFLSSSCEDCKYAVVKDMQNWPNRLYCTACLPDKTTPIDDVSGSPGYIGGIQSALWCVDGWYDREFDIHFEQYTAPFPKHKLETKVPPGGRQTKADEPKSSAVKTGPPRPKPVDALEDAAQKQPKKPDDAREVMAAEDSADEGHGSEGHGSGQKITAEQSEPVQADDPATVRRPPAGTGFVLAAIVLCGLCIEPTFRAKLFRLCYQLFATLINAFQLRDFMVAMGTLLSRLALFPFQLCFSCICFALGCIYGIFRSCAQAAAWPFYAAIGALAPHSTAGPTQSAEKAENDSEAGLDPSATPADDAADDASEESQKRSRNPKRKQKKRKPAPRSAEPEEDGASSAPLEIEQRRRQAQEEEKAEARKHAQWQREQEQGRQNERDKVKREKVERLRRAQEQEKRRRQEKEAGQRQQRQQREQEQRAREEERLRLRQEQRERLRREQVRVRHEEEAAAQRERLRREQERLRHEEEAAAQRQREEERMLEEQEQEEQEQEDLLRMAMDAHVQAQASPASPPTLVFASPVESVVTATAVFATDAQQQQQPPRPGGGPLGANSGRRGDFSLLRWFLTDIGLVNTETERLLIENEVDFDALCLCTDDDFRELGILKGPRVKMLRQMAQWSERRRQL